MARCMLLDILTNRPDSTREISKCFPCSLIQASQYGILKANLSESEDPAGTELVTQTRYIPNDARSWVLWCRTNSTAVRRRRCTATWPKKIGLMSKWRLCSLSSNVILVGASSMLLSTRTVILECTRRNMAMDGSGMAHFILTKTKEYL
jgi:hypothetical protein